MYDYGYGSAVDSAGGILAGFCFLYIIMLALNIFSIVCMWKLFKKAGKKGWTSIVPIYNFIVLIEIAELPMWYIALFFVPFANIYAMFKIYIEIAHKFGKSTGFGVAMVFFSIICIPMLAFGKDEYKGKSGTSTNNNVNPQPNIQNNMYSNQQVNMPNNNLSPNVMDVNNSMGVQPMFNVNMQNSENPFKPVGNVNNNVQNMNLNNMDSINNTPVQNVNNLTNNVSSLHTRQPNASEAQLNNIQSNVNQNNLSNMKKTCPNCGSQIDYSSIFCNNCGQNL